MVILLRVGPEVVLRGIQSNVANSAHAVSESSVCNQAGWVTGGWVGGILYRWWAMGEGSEVE